MLIATKKTHYVVFSETLKFEIDREMKVTKVHRGSQFETKKMVANYIKLNIDQRAAAGND